MAPEAIGKYRVISELGRGAMGSVYLAEDPHIGRQVAVKLMRPQSEEGPERFLQEARTVGSLSHPNIVLLHDFGFEGETPYLVMERVAGVTLDRWLGARPAAARLRVLVGLCRAVAYAHERGVLHRDLKPSNVLVQPDGEPKLLDFGIARAQDTRLTATGIVLGTPEYLAPELLGSGTFSTRSDVYALGLVAYELFGGRNPFRAETLASCLRRVLEVEPPPLGAPGTAASDASPELAAAILACLAKDPARRPATSQALLAAAERQLAGRAAVAIAPTVRMVPALAARRRVPRIALVVAGALAVTLAAALVFVRVRLPDPVAAPTPAPADASRSAPTPAGPRTAVPTPPPSAVATSPVATRPSATPPTATALAPAQREPPSGALASRPVAPAEAERSALTAARDAAAGVPAAGRVTRRDLEGVEPRAAAGADAARGSERVPAGATPASAAERVAAQPPAADAAAPEDPRPSPRLAAASPSAPPPPPAPALRLVSVSPATLPRGQLTRVRVAGEGLAAALRPRFTRGGAPASGIRVTRTTALDGGAVELSLRVDDDAALGSYSLTLVSPGGEATNALTVEVVL